MASAKHDQGLSSGSPMTGTEQQGAFEPLMFSQPNREDSALVNVSWCAFTRTINLNCISGFMLIDGITGNANVLVDADGARMIANYLLESVDRIGNPTAFDTGPRAPVPPVPYQCGYLMGLCRGIHEDYCSTGEVRSDLLAEMRTAIDSIEERQ